MYKGAASAAPFLLLETGLPVIVKYSPLLFLLLAACGSSDQGDGVGGVSVDEAQALNEAAEILDQRYEDSQAAFNASSR